jgi:hypothetical protein
VARLLGNTNHAQSENADANNSASTAAANPISMAAASIPNPVLKFLNSREPPKALVIKSEASNNPNATNVDLRKMHQAGGYDFSSYEARNWSEIYMHISKF